MKECFDYILIELSKKCVRKGKAGFIAGDDEEIYSLAVHYYDEDDIKIGKKNFTTNADNSATVAQLQNLSKTVTSSVAKEKKSSVKKKAPVSKKKVNEKQLSIFDFGDAV